MTEKLKTLKDINLYAPTQLRADAVQQELKQEAIKWIKSIKDDTIIDKECEACKSGNIKIIDTAKVTGDPLAIQDKIEEDLIIYWIKHFFNITEKEIEDS